MRERGLKSVYLNCKVNLFDGRSREGAWIEISICRRQALKGVVAPVRERGLKFVNGLLDACTKLVAPVRERGLKCDN